LVFDGFPLEPPNRSWFFVVQGPLSRSARRLLEDHLATGCAGAGAEVDDVVGARDHVIESTTPPVAISVSACLCTPCGAGAILPNLIFMKPRPSGARGTITVDVTTMEFVWILDDTASFIGGRG
jgi:hypothetical protein